MAKNKVYKTVDNLLTHYHNRSNINDMEQTVDFLKENKEGDFSIADMQLFNLFPWARSYETIRKLIKRDFFGENVLKAKIEGEGRRVRYFVKGKNIIHYLDKYGEILAGTARKPKRK